MVSYFQLVNNKLKIYFSSVSKFVLKNIFPFPLSSFRRVWIRKEVELAEGTCMPRYLVGRHCVSPKGGMINLLCSVDMFHFQLTTCQTSFTTFK